MKTSDRIILQKPGPVPEDLTRTELAKWLFGYFRATHDAAQIATETDALMADLAESLQKLMILTDGGGTWTLKDQDRAQAALKHYQEYVK